MYCNRFIIRLITIRFIVRRFVFRMVSFRGQYKLDPRPDRLFKEFISQFLTNIPVLFIWALSSRALPRFLGRINK